MKRAGSFNNSETKKRKTSLHNPELFSAITANDVAAVRTNLESGKEIDFAIIKQISKISRDHTAIISDVSTYYIFQQAQNEEVHIAAENIYSLGLDTDCFDNACNSAFDIAQSENDIAALDTLCALAIYESVLKQEFSGVRKKLFDLHNIQLSDNKFKILCQDAFGCAISLDQDIAKEFLDNGYADLITANSNGELPVTFAEENQPEFRDVISHYLAKPLAKAIQNHDKKEINRLISCGADVEYPYKGISPLTRSVIAEDAEITDIFLLHEAEPMVNDKHGNSALAIAIKKAKDGSEPCKKIAESLSTQILYYAAVDENPRALREAREYLRMQHENKILDPRVFAKYLTNVKDMLMDEENEDALENIKLYEATRPTNIPLPQAAFDFGDKSIKR